MQTGEALTLTLRRDEQGPFIVVRPQRADHRSFSDAPYRSIEDVFAGYGDGYRPGETDWGSPVGAEVIE